MATKELVLMVARGEGGGARGGAGGFRRRRHEVASRDCRCSVIGGIASRDGAHTQLIASRCQNSESYSTCIFTAFCTHQCKSLNKPAHHTNGTAHSVDYARKNNLTTQYIPCATDVPYTLYTHAHACACTCPLTACHITACHLTACQMDTPESGRMRT